MVVTTAAEAHCLPLIYIPTFLLPGLWFHRRMAGPQPLKLSRALRVAWMIDMELKEPHGRAW